MVLNEFTLTNFKMQVKVKNIKVNGTRKLNREMVWEYSFGKMAPSMKDAGKEGNALEKEE